jgi:predicted Ser/Thr protein kinase
MEQKQCPQCGAELPADAPEGLCPQCLMKKGLKTEPVAGKGEGPDTQGIAPAATERPGGFVPPEPAVLAGEFPQLEVIELLGQGGMGAVYKARQPGLDRLVALKVLPPEVGQDPAFAERFTREARALARLNHPHIVSVYDFGKAQSGLFYFVMEFVDGTDLRHVIKGGEISPHQALAIVPQICEALQYAHEEGVVHRDIKPENVLLDKKGRVRIADFGLAKLLDRPATAFTLTHPSQKMGTPHYMAPEQVEHPHDVDHRADIYSLGVVFYEMLTGELPLGRFPPPSRKVRIDVRLDEVVLKTLEKEPELRYQQASEVKTAVDTIRSEEPCEGSEAKKAAGPKPADGSDSIDSIRHRVWIPAVGLMAAGVINCLAAMGLTVGSLVGLIQRGFGLAVIPEAVRFLVVAALAAYSIVVLMGGWNMLQLRSHRTAVVGSVFGLLPFSPGAVLGLPAGIWALYLLTKEQVKAAFGQEGTDVSIPPKVRQFAVSAVEEVKVAFGQGKAEFEKLRKETARDRQNDRAQPSGKSTGMAIISFVFGLLSIMSVSAHADSAVRFSFGFTTAFLGIFMGVMAIKSIKSYGKQLLPTIFAWAGILFASGSAIALLTFFLKGH